MEKFQLLREEALKNYRMADHILTVTYPLVQDTKLLLGVADNLFLSLTNAMGAILHHDRIFKLVPPFEDNFESKYNAFCNKPARRYEVDQKYLKLIKEIKEIIVLHKTSPIEFRRKDRFVICAKDYQMRAITANQLKDYLKEADGFLSLMKEVTSKNERLFQK